MPLGTTAPVMTKAGTITKLNAYDTSTNPDSITSGNLSYAGGAWGTSQSAKFDINSSQSAGTPSIDTNLFADLTNATAASWAIIKY